MKSVRREDTAPELSVRRFLHASGLRYRLHDRSLPGTPDVVLPRYRTVVFVHGCFWHGHDCAHGAVRSRTNTAFWTEKIEANRARDERKKAALIEAGWQVETIWECQAKDSSLLGKLVGRIRRAPAAKWKASACDVSRMRSRASIAVRESG